MIVTCLLCGLKEEHEARGLGAPEGKEPQRRTYYRLYKRAWYQRQKAA